MSAVNKELWPYAPNPTQTMVDTLMKTAQPAADTPAIPSPAVENIKFKHFRFEEIDPNNKDTVIIPQGGVTLAYSEEKNLEDEEGLSKFIYAMAWCHHTDNYNKKIGRAIATGRLVGRHADDWKQEMYCPNLTEFFEYIADVIEEEYLSMGCSIEDLNLIY